MRRLTSYRASKSDLSLLTACNSCTNFLHALGSGPNLALQWRAGNLIETLQVTASRVPPVLSFKPSSVSSLKFLWSKRAQFKCFNDAENRSLYIMEFWVQLKIRVSTGTVSLGVKHQFVPYHKLHLLYHGTGLSPTLYCSRNLSNCNHFFCVFFSTKGWPFPVLTTFWPWHIKSSCLNNVPEISRCHMELPWYLRLGNAGVHRRCNQGLLAIDKSDELRTFNALRPGQ